MPNREFDYQNSDINYSLFNNSDLLFVNRDPQNCYIENCEILAKGCVGEVSEITYENNPFTINAP